MLKKGQNNKILIDDSFHMVNCDKNNTMFCVPLLAGLYIWKSLGKGIKNGDGKEQRKNKTLMGFDP